jgi:hypothetical protein
MALQFYCLSRVKPHLCINLEFDSYYSDQIINLRLQISLTSYEKNIYSYIRPAY